MVKEAGMDHTAYDGRKYFISWWSRTCKEGEQQDLLDSVLQVPSNLQKLLLMTRSQSGLGCAPCLSASSFSSVASVNLLLCLWFFTGLPALWLYFGFPLDSGLSLSPTLPGFFLLFLFLSAGFGSLSFLRHWPHTWLFLLLCDPSLWFPFSQRRDPSQFSYAYSVPIRGRGHQPFEMPSNFSRSGDRREGFPCWISL